MANAYIAEFQSLAQDAQGTRLPIAPLAPLTEQIIAYTSAAASAAFDERTKYIRVIADAVAHFAVGEAPVATGNDPYMAADVAEYFAVKGTHKMSFYDGIT